MIYFSFVQWLLAFLAPCAIALLPWYIVSFISRNSEKNHSKLSLLLRWLKLAWLSILGFVVIYGIAGIIIMVSSQLIKDNMQYIAITMGVVLIILGILMLFGKNISLSLHIKQRKHNNETAEAFFFGIAYAIGAIGCLFPLFLVVVTQALVAPTIFDGVLYILFYLLWMSTLMISVMVLSVFAKDYLMRQLRVILPYMEKISAILLIVAGLYVIQYQLVLL